MAYPNNEVYISTSLTIKSVNLSPLKSDIILWKIFY